MSEEKSIDAGGSLPPPTGSVFEIVDCTGEEQYGTLGTFPTMADAMSALADGDDAEVVKSGSVSFRFSGRGKKATGDLLEDLENGTDLGEAYFDTPQKTSQPKVIARKYYWQCSSCKASFLDTRRLCSDWEDGFRCPRCGRKCARDHEHTNKAGS